MRPMRAGEPLVEPGYQGVGVRSFASSDYEPGVHTSSKPVKIYSIAHRHTLSRLGPPLELLMSLSNPPAHNTASPFASMKGHHVAVRVPDFQAAKRWYVEKLDFRVIHEWPYADLQLAYVGPATDDHFYIELLGDGEPGPLPKPVYTDLGD